MAAGKTAGSKAELSALSRAGEALSSGDLNQTARYYVQAAGARERSGADPFPHYLKALDFYAAAGHPRRGITLARRLIKRRDRAALGHRPLVRLRLAQLLEQTRKQTEARVEYQLALEGLPPREPVSLEAGLGLARTQLWLADIESLSKNLRELVSRAQRSDNRRVEASAILLQAQAFHWSGDWFGALKFYDRALQLVEQGGLRSLAFACCTGLAAVYQRLRMYQDARDFAARGYENTRRLHDSGASAAGALIYASALNSQALHLEENEAPGVAVGLRRESRRLLAGARKHFRRAENHTMLTRCWLEEQRLALQSPPRAAARAAVDALHYARKAGVEDYLLLARALRLLRERENSTPAEWRALAHAAEHSGASEIASATWLAVHERLSSGDGEGVVGEGALDALAAAFHWGARPRPGMASLPLPGWLPGDAMEVASKLARRAGRDEAEPKIQSLEWTLAGAGAASLPAPGASPGENLSAARYSLLAAARLEEAGRAGQSRLSAAQRASLDRARTAYSKDLESAGPPAPVVPQLGETEAMIVLGNQDGVVHAWVIRPPERVAVHLESMTEQEWRDAAESFDQQLLDARGWPDAIIPETLVRTAQSALRQVGTRLWTPLWPALQGAAQILIVPDANLPLLPFGALALAAQPSNWPRPHAVSLLPNPGLGRAGRWRTPSGSAYAVATRDAGVPVAQREAQGVIRILGGEVDATSSLRLDEDGERPELTRRLRKARLVHVAAPVYTIAEHPGFSYVDLGNEPLPFWWLLRERHSLRLLVLPSCAPEGPDTPGLGRVVGVIGPEGAQQIGAPPAEARSRPDLHGLTRYLLDGGIERVVLGAHCGDDTAPSLVTSTFYAGLARGDRPAEALFLAQRNAWREELHPVLWSGFSCWGWP